MVRKGLAVVEGSVSKGYDPVRKAFVENFARRGELGGAVCVYRDGEKVVDLWGGVRDKRTGAPWQADTMVLVFSATKGLAAMAVAIAHSRGWLDYDERVCTYWPEFAAHGKETVTARQLLAHQAGLHALDAPVDREVVADLDRLAVVLANQRPAWAPGERQAYHAISLGFYESELVRRVDPQHRSLGQIFADEIATPLGADAYIRLPEQIPNDRLARLEKVGPIAGMIGMPLRLLLASMRQTSPIHRALVTNPGPWLPLDDATVYARNLEVPSGGGVVSARGLARVYAAFAGDGREIGLRPATLAALAAPAVPPQRGFFDECVLGEVQFSLGFMKPSPNWRFGNVGAFGSPGSGGSLGYADPQTRTGYAYVTNRLSAKLTGDPRDVALREAMPLAIRAAA